MFQEDDESSLGRDICHTTMEYHSPDEYTMACHLTSIEEDGEEDAEGHFPTASLNDDVWMEEPVPDRHLCIHEDSQHDLCLYPCLYSLAQLHVTPNYALQYMNLSNIFNLPDAITTASDKDIPNLEDVLQL